MRWAGEWSSTRGTEPLGCSDTCPNTIERYVWDGEQLLYELRAPGGSTSNLQTAWGSGKQYGRVGYLHGAGLDAPLGVMRMSHSEGTFLLVGYTNWRGQYARGTLHQSSWPECNGSNGPSCILIDWPAPKLRIYLDGYERPKGDWLGSLLQDQRDQSGLLYRRNRYYDPATGQFTQQDPIGLAGGLNLYGFANGDPVNYSDPFGLCPQCGVSVGPGFPAGQADRPGVHLEERGYRCGARSGGGGRRRWRSEAGSGGAGGAGCTLYG